LFNTSNIPVIYEDQWLLVADKPSGLLTIPTPKNEQRTLTSILNNDLKERGMPYRLHPCHRLDRETSGLMIYAKGKAIQKQMMQLFKDRKVKKAYIAFVQGQLKPAQGEINASIEGRQAVTRYSVIENRQDFTVVEATPLTGRANQIRIHFKHIGHPLVGESKFAFRKDYKLRAKRVCLHAKYLRFIHPVTEETLSISSELAKDLEVFLRTHTD
jgi:23S rRNA pseudouridine1911/1915/1917 synthase